jgi:hypothetical protein
MYIIARNYRNLKFKISGKYCVISHINIQLNAKYVKCYLKLKLNIDNSII